MVRLWREECWRYYRRKVDSPIKLTIIVLMKMPRISCLFLGHHRANLYEQSLWWFLKLLLYFLNNMIKRRFQFTFHLLSTTWKVTMLTLKLCKVQHCSPFVWSIIITKLQRHKHTFLLTLNVLIYRTKMENREEVRHTSYFMKFWSSILWRSMWILPVKKYNPSSTR